MSSSRESATSDAFGRIAVVGLAGRFPGAADPSELWENLRRGVESVRFFADEELRAAGVDEALLRDPAYVKAAARLEGTELFDAAFFEINPREAELTDPQHRIFLECAWEALEDAGYDPARFSGAIGVFAGTGRNHYLRENLAAASGLLAAVGPVAETVGGEKDFVATRVSHKLDLRGPSVSVQTACSTSLVATHLACQSLLAGECDMVLAGGVSVTGLRDEGYLHVEGGIFSPDGHLRAFDAAAAGQIGGNGAAVIVLRRLEDALRDGDDVRAVILASAVNNDGAQKVGFTAPGVAGQAQVIVEALELAGVEPETITYVEAHGTGTHLGDPIEVRALTEAFRTRTAARGFCALGSLKTNVGHLDAAAGAAGLIKTVLALQHRELPASLHFRAPNPEIDFAASPFYVNAALAPWKAAAPRRAGVSSFGMGGTNAHVLVEEAPPRPAPLVRRRLALVVLSARTESALEHAAERLGRHLERTPDLDLAEVAYTTQVGRAAFAERRALVAGSAAEAVRALRQPQSAGLLASRGRAPESRPPVAFLFPGQGAQHADMARGLYEGEPVFRAALERLCELFRPHLGRDLRELLFPAPERRAEAEELLAHTRFTQPALFAVEHALAQLWSAFGIAPAALAGHSVGELVAAALAGVFSLEDAVALVAARGRLIGELPAGGAMLAVRAAESALAALPVGELDLAAVNAPELCVLSGPADAVARLESELERRGIGSRRLHTSHAFHSRLVDGVVEPFRRAVAAARPKPPQLPLVSCTSGRRLTDAEACDPAYWARHLRQPVRFAPAAATLLESPAQVLLEVGPGTTLTSLARLAPGAAARVVVPSLRHPQAAGDDQAALLAALGRLWCAGVAPDWSAFHAGERLGRVALPTYPFERQRYWIERGATSAPAAPAKRADVADWFYAPTWRRAVRPAAPPPAPGETWLFVADEGGLGAALAERLRAAGGRALLALPGPALAALDDERWALPLAEPAAVGALLERLAAEGKAPAVIVHMAAVDPTGEGARGRAAAVERGFGASLALAQALADRPAHATRLAVVTSGMQEVLGGELVAPEKALVLGVVKSVSAELAHVSARSIDLEPAARGVAAPRVERLFQELCRTAASGAERVVALRGSHVWIPGAAPVRLAREGTKPAALLRQRGTYLITGGLGGIGLALAEGLARSLRARLVLVGRHGLPDRSRWEAWLAGHAPEDGTSRRLEKLRHLEALGAEVLVEAADVADLAAMRGVAERARARFGRVHGVIHCAGVAGGGLLQLRSRAAAAEVLAPKVEGTRVLEQLFFEDGLDFLVLCSSLATQVEGLGQVDYFAANAFLDAFARQRHDAGRARGPAVFSIGWDAWQEVGMAVNTAVPEALREGRAANLAQGIAPREGLDVLERVLDAGLPLVYVSTRELGARLAQERAPDVARAAPPAEVHARPALANEFVAPRSATERAVASLWSELLGIERVGLHDSFFELGGNSLLLMQVSSRLRADFGVNLALRALFDTPDVASLAERVETLRVVREVSGASANGNAASAVETEEYRL